MNHGSVRTHFPLARTHRQPRATCTSPAAGEGLPPPGFNGARQRPKASTRDPRQPKESCWAWRHTRVPTKVCVRSTSHLANYKVEIWGKMSGGGTRQQHRAAPASARGLQHAGAEKPHGRPPTSSLNAHIAEAAHIRIGVSFEHRRILRKHSCWPMRRSTDFEVLDMGDALRTNRYAS